MTFPSFSIRLVVGNPKEERKWSFRSFRLIQALEIIKGAKIKLRCSRCMAEIMVNQARCPKIDGTDARCLCQKCATNHNVHYSLVRTIALMIEHWCRQQGLVLVHDADGIKAVHYRDMERRKFRCLTCGEARPIDELGNPRMKWPVDTMSVYCQGNGCRPAEHECLMNAGDTANMIARYCSREVERSARKLVEMSKERVCV